MNESDLRTAITAHEDAIREHLTDFLNHAIEIGKLTTLFAASVPPPVTPPTHTLPLRAGETTWQRAYTTFYRAAGQDHYIEWLRRAGVRVEDSLRQQNYTGPAIEQMTALTEAERAALIAATR